MWINWISNYYPIVASQVRIPPGSFEESWQRLGVRRWFWPGISVSSYRLQLASHEKVGRKTKFLIPNSDICIWTYCKISNRFSDNLFCHVRKGLISFLSFRDGLCYDCYIKTAIGDTQPLGNQTRCEGERLCHIIDRPASYQKCLIEEGSLWVSARTCTIIQ